MLERTLNAAVTVKCAMKMFHAQPDLVLITRELVALAGKTKSERGKLVASAENKLKVLQREEKEKRKIADALFEEAN
ncbi:hypothetical protein PR048_029152 [Dryococelus australis]|uniref:Uncharacterized protein n=1 Tax=Dryococelus australis TaxID=614101 RepID=A0ABQ9GCJ8_9NEOP|nr:hypothetical protein PR048_029152 [Dryococelus australis]